MLNFLVLRNPSVFKCPVCGGILPFWSSIAQCYFCWSWIMIEDSNHRGTVKVIKKYG